MGNVRPFSPEDALRGKLDVIPEEMILAVNELLATKFNGGECIITQNEVIDKFLSLTGDEYLRHEIFDNHWLDFEEIYRDMGWSVYYDKPGYCETYDAAYRFGKKR